MRIRTRGIPAVAVAAVLVAGVGACGGEDDGGGDDSGSAAQSKKGGADKKTAALIEKTNKVMQQTSFKASGTSTAFEGAEQEIWWDPAHGMRMRVQAKGGTEGEMYCKDGKSFISAPLLAQTMQAQGKKMPVPDDMSDVFVTVPANSQGCQSYFTVPSAGKRTPDLDGAVDGTKTMALSVKNSQTADVYHIAASGKSRILKMESEQKGVGSTTTYSGYGKEYAVTLPPKDQRMAMSEFQQRIAEGG